MQSQPITEPSMLRRLAVVPITQLVLAILPVVLAGIAWLGLAGMALGTGLALYFTRGVWNEDLWFGPVLGVALGSHCGLWAGTVFTMAPKRRRFLLTTVAAGLSNPLIYAFPDWLDGPKGPAWWLMNGATVALPFLCGWLFARAMSGTVRLPLLRWARAAISTAQPLTLRPRLLAGVIAIVLGAGVVAFITVIVAFFGHLLPLAPSPLDRLD